MEKINDDNVEAWCRGPFITVVLWDRLSED